MLTPTFDDLVGQASLLGNLLIGRGEKIAVSESSTGGLIAASLVAVPGASAFMLGGTVVYTLEAGQAFLSGDRPRPSGMRGATVEFATWCAESVAARSGATWGLAETGATGPTGNPYGDPAGHGWCAMVGPAHGDRHSLTGESSRADNMFRFAMAALECAHATVRDVDL
jgi:nicotinamide-nucleotide amidase